MFRARPAPFPSAAPLAAVATVAAVATIALVAPACTPRRDTQRAGSGASGDAAGADTGRVGNTFVVTYDSGPIDRLRIVRDTAGRIVVEGACGFPDGTRVRVALLRAVAGGTYEAAAMTRARVELGRFQSSPLRDESGAPPAPGAPAGVRLLISASFTPGEQTDEVLHASANGRRFSGLGMRELPQGFAVYERTVEAPL